ncbi:uncharacterized protein LOC144180585 [Haemaphysalis longicornis]
MKTPTRMHVVSPKRPVSEEDELAVYWDPRYRRYFYAGVMTPPTGQLYDYRGRPVTLPSDTHTWSVVQLASADPSHPAPPPGPSILLRSGKKGKGRPRRKKRRIKWDFLSAASEEAEVQQIEDDGGREVTSSYRCIVHPLLLAIVVMVAGLVSFMVLLPLSGDSTRSPTTDDAPYTTDPGFIVTLLPLRRRAAMTERPPLGAPHSVGPRVDHSAEHSPLPTTDYVLTTADVQPFDAALSATRPPGHLESRQDLCLGTGSESRLGSPGGNNVTSRVPSNQHCDAIVRCCYSLPVNMSVEDSVTARGDSSTDGLPRAEGGASRTSMLLGVRVGDDAAFQSLLRNWSGERAKFLVDVIRAARTASFSGVRLWVPPREHVTLGFNEHLVSLARDVATELRGRNYTFGFFLPQGLLSQQRGITTAELTEALNAPPYSLLFYPELSAFWNTTTGSTAVTWPTPEEVLARASMETGAVHSSAICYLPPLPVAVQARLAEPCDPNKTQLLTRDSHLTYPALGDVRCRLRENDEWMISARRYYTYACKDSWALLYQTPIQARQFRDDLFVAAPASTCLGSFLGLPYATEEIGSASD